VPFTYRGYPFALYDANEVSALQKLVKKIQVKGGGSCADQMCGVGLEASTDALVAVLFLRAGYARR